MNLRRSGQLRSCELFPFKRYYYLHFQRKFPSTFFLLSLSTNSVAKAWNTWIMSLKIITIALLGIIVSDFGCKEELILPVQTVTKWNVVPALASIDVRYMIQHNNVLYLTAVDPKARLICDSGLCHFIDDRSLVYKTTDAVTWTKIAGFKKTIGPMTFHDDTLYCLADDSIHRMLPSGEWQTAFATPPRLGDASADGDIVFIRDTLYAMQTLFANAAETYRVHPDGSYEEVLSGPDGMLHFSGSKYIKTVRNGKEFIYVRPIYGLWATRTLFLFDGYTYSHIDNGLTDNELFGGSDAMVIKDDTLYVGFGGRVAPGVIKSFVGNQWIQFYDTIPSSHSAYLVTPVLYAQPTAIAFAGDRMFVATNSQGVIEWKQKDGWVRISEGLKPGNVAGLQEPDLRYPLPFLQYFKGKLVAAYGKPGYAPWGETGVYTYNLQ